MQNSVSLKCQVQWITKMLLMVLCFNLKHSQLLSWLLQIADVLSDMVITLLNNFV